MNAEHAAAARAVDCMSLRHQQTTSPTSSGGQQLPTRLGSDEPYLADEAMSLPASTPQELRQAIEQRTRPNDNAPSGGNGGGDTGGGAANATQSEEDSGGGGGGENEQPDETMAESTLPGTGEAPAADNVVDGNTADGGENDVDDVFEDAEEDASEAV